ncbi:stage II sporulation protein D [Jeotgalibacillus soli]|uniref:Sporulation stage II protein D amidase enhancer LytB N-terminal domain-containing protein n=1 Tax=Jeotgalibacillus soli TaxID=889306 RepID=A0A0C2RHY2_9BACL|nr:stage II sporulation protein D [Jeotgalibacillus soli]KIL49780.1 hypothetical protein KP78_12480 [Jeotgalibacillus soli]
MKKKPLWIVLFSYLLILLCIPAVVLLPQAKKEGASQEMNQPAIEQQNTEKPEDAAITVAVFRVSKQQVEQMELEKYVEGVVASEMPASFEEEALKAQALAARTYITRMMTSGGVSGLEMPADITDTVAHQVYKSDDELKIIWGKDYEWQKKKIKEAVAATKGEILTYEGKPITASFFSTSNGWTENAKDYWEEDVPYLKSVPSEWDEKTSPGFLAEVTIPVNEFEEKLGINLQEGEMGTVTARTPGNRIKTVSIAGETFSGREIREKLQLRSTDFHWKQKGNAVVIQTKGYGHGVGMSQYGANGMAKEGKKYDEILAHYFKGVKIESVEPFISAVIAQR